MALNKATLAQRAAEHTRDILVGYGPELLKLEFDRRENLQSAKDRTAGVVISETYEHVYSVILKRMLQDNDQ